MPKFDRVRFLDDTLEFLERQNARCYRPYDPSSGLSAGCQYRNGELRCAFGFHIPDALYNVNMEGDIASTVLTRYPALLQHIESKYGEMDEESDFVFISAVQDKLHDDNLEGDFSHAGLMQRAQRLSLSYNLGKDYLGKN